MRGNSGCVAQFRLRPIAVCALALFAPAAVGAGKILHPEHHVGRPPGCQQGHPRR